ncbi:MAG: glycosyltransferase family 39 protein [Anaerolineales bacterium]|nr:glycosyltransferase family 39 protein [Anaerolineales bacterium]
MNQKVRAADLFLLIALLFGIILRFYPVFANGFPLNDGGMFYAVVSDIKENRYQPPLTLSYNQADIPFTYPPLAFYLVAALSDLIPVPLVNFFLYLPAIFNTLSIFALYLLMREIASSQEDAALTTALYALTGNAFAFQIMGGGVTRALGVLFLLLTAWQAAKLFREYRPRRLLFTILFGAGATLSHPQAALHTAAVGAILFLTYRRTKRGILSALIVGAGVLLLSAPWWTSALSRYGVAPLLSASATSARSLSSYLYTLRAFSPLNFSAIPFLIFMYLGIWISIRRQNFLYLAWMTLSILLDPRGAGNLILYAPSAALAAIGLNQLSARINHQNADALQRRAGGVIVFSLFLWIFLLASATDFQLINNSLKKSDLEIMDWAKRNTEADAAFVIADGSTAPQNDPFQEWFPALTERQSRTTLQGLEWTLGEKFFARFEQLTALQQCADMTCLQTRTSADRVEFDYLITLMPASQYADEVERVTRLNESARAADDFIFITQINNALIFKRR